MSAATYRGRLWLATAALAWAAGTGGAATLYNEQFNTSTEGWLDRDAGEMAVAWAGGFGNPAGSLSGTFSAQAVPSPEADAFRATSASSGGPSGAFAGNYWVGVPGFSAWRFSFYADDVLPSDLTVRFGDGINVFSRAVGSQVTQVDRWFTVDVPLTYAGWFGGLPVDFSNALAAVTFVDVQISRSGGSPQTYYLDNFEIRADPVLIPEPTTGLYFLGAILIYGLRRHRKQPAAA